MAQEKSTTPEKQLLKLIENQETVKNSKIRFQNVKHHRIQLFSFGWWTSRFSFSKDILKKWLTRRKSSKLDVKALNRILVLSIFLLFIYLVNSIYVSVINFKGLPVLGDEPKSGKATAGSLTVLSRLKDAVSHYIDIAGQRDLFKMGMKKTTSDGEKIVSGPSSDTLRAAERLKLVGISWSKEPDAMIEDKKALKTFFVKKGDKIGDAEIVEIFRDKVIIAFEGESVELR